MGINKDPENDTRYPAESFEISLYSYEGLSETERSVLEAALLVIIDKGYSGLSMREISKRAKVSLGTITYHFPDKATLVAKALEIFVEGEIAKLPYAKVYGGTPEKVLELAIINQINITLSPLSRRFDFEYWAYAERNVEARESLNRIFNRLIEMMADLICEARPEVDMEEARRRSAVIQTLIEGMPIILPPPDMNPEKQFENNFKDDVLASAMTLALGTETSS